MLTNIKNLKVALVHEELTQLGGAERVLDVLHEIFPKAPIFTLVWDRFKTQHKYDKLDVRPSFIQKLPFAIKNYKWYLGLMPLAVESFNLKNFDLIISDASALVKGVKTKEDQLHICYCHTPTRYLWTDTKDYLKTAPIPKILRPVMPLAIWFLRRWDLKAAQRPDFYIANSRNIANKIYKYYHRDSTVIYPPVETDKFHLSPKLADYFFMVARLEPYKKVDLVIQAFNQLPRLKLKIAGGGTKQEEFAKIAGSNISFIGRVSDTKLAELYAHARAFIFPQEEDFGITAVEAQAAGRPVVAFKKGGALESIIEGKTGEFFHPQTAEALVKVLKKFQSGKYNPKEVRAQALKFDKSLFKEKIKEYINSKLNNKILNQKS